MRLTDEEAWELYGPKSKDVTSGIKDFLPLKKEKEIRIVSENSDSIHLKRNYQGKYGFECKVYFDASKPGGIDNAIKKLKEMVEKLKTEFEIEALK